MALSHRHIIVTLLDKEAWLVCWLHIHTYQFMCICYCSCMPLFVGGAISNCAKILPYMMKICGLSLHYRTAS